MAALIVPPVGAALLAPALSLAASRLALGGADAARRAVDAGGDDRADRRQRQPDDRRSLDELTPSDLALAKFSTRSSSTGVADRRTRSKRE